MTPLNVLLSHIVLDLTRDAERRDPKVNVVQWSDFWRVADGARPGRSTSMPEFRVGR